MKHIIVVPVCNEECGRPDARGMARIKEALGGYDRATGSKEIVCLGGRFADGDESLAQLYADEIIRRDPKLSSVVTALPGGSITVDDMRHLLDSGILKDNRGCYHDILVVADFQHFLRIRKVLTCLGVPRETISFSASGERVPLKDRVLEVGVFLLTWADPMWESPLGRWLRKHLESGRRG